MTIAYVCNPTSVHEAKWINYFSKKYKVIICCGEGVAIAHPLIQHIPIFRIFPSTYPLLSVLKRYHTLQRFKKVIEQQDVDIIHAMYAVPNAFWAWKVAIRPYLVTTRGSDILINYKIDFHKNESLKERIRNYFLRRSTEQSLNAARYITSTSARQQFELKRFIQDSEKLRLIRTGVDASKYDTTNVHQPNKRSEEGVVKVFCPRSMLPIYNLHILVKAFKILQNSCLRYTLTLLDDRPDTGYSELVRKEVANCGLNDAVTFLPKQNFNGMRDLYHHADMVVMIPSSDGTPNSAIEAMLMKKPVILSDLPYDEDIFNEETVWKISELTEEFVASKIKEVVQLDEERKEFMIKKAYSIALEKANLEIEVKKVDRLYQKICSENSNK